MIVMKMEMVSNDGLMMNVDGDGDDEFCGVITRSRCAMRSIEGWGVVPRMAPPSSQVLGAEAVGAEA